MTTKKAIKRTTSKSSNGIKITEVSSNPSTLKSLKFKLGIIIAIFSFLLYSLSLSFKYTLDDPTVLKENSLVTKGFKGIPEILKTDYWFGTNIRIPEYRPAPLFVYAVIWQVFPDNPVVFHLLNVFLYAICCWLLFLVLCRLFEKQNLLFPFICCLLYSAHPLHTEVVNSIKSLDEILCFLFALLSVLYILDYVSQKSIVKLILGVVFFFFSLLSKETGISYLLITPLILFVFTKTDVKRIVIPSMAMVLATALFFFIRYKVLEGVPAHGFNSPMNNSLTTAPDFISQKATAFYVLLKYILSLVVPYQLSFDYSYAQIPILKISNPIAIISILFYLAMGVYAVLKIKQKDVLAFAILFYLFTLAPVSNIFLIIGSPMAERFMFMPSLGYCIILTYLLIKLSKSEQFKSKFNSIKQFFLFNSTLFILVFIIIGLYAAKTLARSQNWKDNITLFEHDAEVVDNSAKAHLSLGCAYLMDLYPLEKNKAKKKQYIDKEIEQFSKAIAIYPNYQDAYMNLAVAYTDKMDYPNAIRNYEKVMQLSPTPDPKVYVGLSSIYLSLGQNEMALAYADSAFKYPVNSSDPYNNRACALEGLGRYTEAIPDFEKALELNPKSGIINRNIGGNYGNLKQYQKAIDYLLKSYQYDSSDPKTVYYLGITYQVMGDSANGKFYLEKANHLNAQ